MRDTDRDFLGGTCSFSLPMKLSMDGKAIGEILNINPQPECGSVCCIAVIKKVRRWVTPPHPYFVFEESDEEYLRWAGIGREENATETTTIPRAMVTELTAGAIVFKPLASAFPNISWETAMDARSRHG